MKTRIISGMAALVFLAVVMFLGRAALGMVVFIISLIGMHEFYSAARSGGYKPFNLLGYLFCLPLLFITLSNGKATGIGVIDTLATIKGISFCIFILLIVLFCLIVFLNERYNLIDISVTLFGIFYVAFLFSFVILTRNLDNGYLYIWLIFIGAWSTDIFAYFTGVSIGKTKILPAISPKKSLEGSIGGIIGCMAAILVFGLYISQYINGIPFYHYIILGLLCSIVSQVGDWAASAVKRFVKIKDYGRIMPGHGGVLDRVDSLLFVAPTVYFYIIMVIQ
jgi:phosphatidate cytidylyltransferase